MDGEDLVVWEDQFGTGSTPLVAAASMVIEPAMANSQQPQTAALAAESLSAELVDAALAMDLALRAGSGARFAPPDPMREDRSDWISQSTRWAQPMPWQGRSEIAEHYLRSRGDKGGDGGFFRDADADTVSEELLDELFTECPLP